MSQRYRAYLLRHWHLVNGRERVEVQHIQSGERTHHPTLAAACAWLTEQARAPTDAEPTLARLGTPRPPPDGGGQRAQHRTPGEMHEETP